MTRTTTASRSLLEKFVRTTLREGSTFGTVPPVEWFEEKMGGEPFRMNLKGADSLAFNYAIKESPAAGRTDTPEELRETVIALVSAPDPHEKYGKSWDSDEVPAEVYAWEARYSADNIREHAESLASSIMSVLGEEWI